MKRGDGAVAFLGRHTEFDGKLSFSGTFRIDGRFKGEIDGRGTLIVGEKGFVESDINVSYVVITGEIHGNISADQKIEIHVPGKVVGDIQAPTVVIDEGLLLVGNCRIQKPERVPEFNLSGADAEGSATGIPTNLGTIFGTVTDGNTGRPVKNVVIKASCKKIGKRQTRTDEFGYYELTGLMDGAWRLKRKAKGLKKGIAVVEISGGGTYEHNFD